MLCGIGSTARFQSLFKLISNIILWIRIIATDAFFLPLRYVLIHSASSPQNNSITHEWKNPEFPK